MDALILLREAFLNPSSGKLGLFNVPSGECLEVDFKVSPSVAPSSFTHILGVDGKSLVERTAATAFKSKRGSGPAYPLDACLVCLWYEGAGYKDYLQACRKTWSGVQAVSLVDRKDLLAYLTGKAESSAYLDTMAPLVPVFNKDSLLSSKSVESAAAAAETFPKTITSTDIFGDDDDDDDQDDEDGDEQKVKKVQDRHKSVAAKKESRSKRQQPEETEESRILKKIRELTRPPIPVESLVLLPGKNFKGILETMSFDREKSALNPKPSSAAASSSHLSSAKHASKSTSSTAASSTAAASAVAPIIIVPASMTSLINLFNIKSFLEEQRYVPVEEAKKKNPVKPHHVYLQHGGKRYKVVDSVHRFQKSDWEQVIAVVVQGPLWQFKGWKWDTPVEIFTHVQGFHVHFEDSPLDPAVKGWHVQCLAIGREKRHLDRPAVFKFWDLISQ